MRAIPTFRPEINHKRNKDKTYSVFIRITLNRKMKRLPTGVFLLKESDFNKKASFGKWVRTSELENKTYNEMLEALIKEYKKKVFDFLQINPHPTLEEIIEHLTQIQTTSLLDYHDSEIKRYKAIGKYKYSEKQKYAGYSVLIDPSFTV